MSCVAVRCFCCELWCFVATYVVACCFVVSSVVVSCFVVNCDVARCFVMGYLVRCL